MGGHCWRFYDYSAECEDCGWKSTARNAQGNAAQHSRRYDHTVRVDVYGHVSYLSDAENEQRRAAKGGT